MKKITFIFTTIGFLSACNPTLEEVKSLQDAYKNNNREVSVTGIYTPSMLSKRENQNLSPTGQFKIVVNDSLSVILLPPYLPESKRPAKEVAELQGKKVRVIGLISRKTYMDVPSIKNEPLSVSIPCFTQIKKIESLE